MMEQQYGHFTLNLTFVLCAQMDPIFKIYSVLPSHIGRELPSGAVFIPLIAHKRKCNVMKFGERGGH
jgi:hypothetical protein